MTVDQSYKDLLAQLRSIYEQREAGNIADWVLESIAHIKRIDRVTDKQKQLDEVTIQQLNNVVKQLLEHKPIQYVLGEVWFYKMKLKVNEHVLIPRPETEELVEWAVEDLRSTMFDVRNERVGDDIEPRTSDILHILDVGTGSGCIAVALKKEIPGSEVFAIDVSEDALQVAKENASDQDVVVNFLQLDFLDETSWESLSAFDVIISNPPYIPEKEISSLAENVVEYEPHLALFVTDEDPFIFYKKIAAFAGEHLKKGGKIFVEIHESYAENVKLVFEEKNFKTEARKDIYGRERMIKAYR